ncbi:MAG: ABC transporter ATP-binding protein [Bacteroidota bacterium]|nr:ABC transporter ATP-binding protein [Bacteroidota bacterium]
MSTIIKVDNISKQYRLGIISSGTLSHDLNRWWASMRGKEDPFLKIGEENDRSKKGESDYVWALRNINFEVKQGDVLGIIGKNGAGKSTLLKILSRVTAPTTGQIKVKGRIASLLEVGTGFHPELTGRENVFLNGAILGMTKAEIKNKFDEIVDFSSVEKYIDTPVKRYSSGMHVRLAFAVAAHLEPEILIIDEVLAVGDAEFQKKCIGKMKDVSGQGRTVLFVSHNMASVKSLCTSGVVLSNGGISYMGDIDKSVAEYMNIGSVNGVTEYKVFEGENKVFNTEVDILSAGIRAVGKNYGEAMRMDEDLELSFKMNKKTANWRMDATIHVKDANGNYLFSSGSGTIIGSNENKTGIIDFNVSIPKNFFNADTFHVNLLVVKNRKSISISINDVFSFNIINKEHELGTWMGKELAPLKPKFPWNVNY